MTYRLLAALLGLAMAGCASSEPQDLSYAPAKETAPPAASSLAPAQPPVMPTSVANTQPIIGAAGFPSAPGCVDGAAGASCRTAMPRNNCRTIGNVTTCDVPADPEADTTLYTN